MGQKLKPTTTEKLKTPKALFPGDPPRGGPAQSEEVEAKGRCKSSDRAKTAEHEKAEREKAELKEKEAAAQRAKVEREKKEAAADRAKAAKAAEAAKAERARRAAQAAEDAKTQELLEKTERLRAMKRQRERDELQKECDELEALLNGPATRPRLGEPSGLSKGIHNKERTPAATAVVRAARAPNKDRALAAREMQTWFARTVPEMIRTSAHITAARSWLAIVDMPVAEVSAGQGGPLGIGSRHTASAESLVGSTPSAESRGESVWAVARATGIGGRHNIYKA